MMRFKDMEAFQTWQVERDVNMKALECPGSMLPEDKADEGPESILSGKIVKYCKKEALPCLCFPQTKDVMKFLPPGWVD